MNIHSQTPDTGENLLPKAPQWHPNVIIADADYVDRVVFNLIVNFERMLGRRIPQADFARWIDCIALDGGMKQDSEGITTVVLLHDKTSMAMENFVPANYGNDLDGKAFKDNLGEFCISALPVELLTTKDAFLKDIVEMAAERKEVKRIMVIPNAEDSDIYDQLRHSLRNVDDDKRITIFAMQPMAGGNFRQEILGYSLMQALGIRGEEI